MIELIPGCQNVKLATFKLFLSHDHLECKQKKSIKIKLIKIIFLLLKYFPESN